MQINIVELVKKKEETHAHATLKHICDKTARM